MHLRAGTWTIVPSPNPGYANTRLYAVSAVSSEDVWAVGYYHDAESADRTLAITWTSLT